MRKTWQTSKVKIGGGTSVTEITFLTGGGGTLNAHPVRTYRNTFYPICISGRSGMVLMKVKGLSDTHVGWMSNIDPICWKRSLKLVKTVNSVERYRSRRCIEDSILDFHFRVFGSASGRKWNSVLDLKLKFTILSVT